MQNLKIDVDKIGGKLVASKSGKKYIQLPYDARYMESFGRKDGTIGISLVLSTNALKEPRERDNFKETELIKPNLKKEDYEKLTDEQKEKIPVCGSVSIYKKQEPEPEQPEVDIQEENDDLPF